MKGRVIIKCYNLESQVEHKPPFITLLSKLFKIACIYAGCFSSASKVLAIGCKKSAFLV